MSVSRDQYLMYGISLPHSYTSEWEEKTGKDWYDTFEEYEDYPGKDGIFFLVDGMNGNHVVLGKVLAASRAKGYDDGILADDEPLTIPSIDIGTHGVVSNALCKIFMPHDGRGYGKRRGWKFGTYLITHYH